MERIVLDSTFLVDFQRARAGKGGTGVFTFLQAHSDSELLASVVAWGEFLEGIQGNSLLENRLERLLEIVPVTRATSEEYAKIARTLRARGTLIGANDLWIAATCLELDCPCATRNVKEFSRVPGLKVLAY